MRWLDGITNSMDLQHFAANGGVGQAIDHANARLLLGHFAGVAGRTQVLAQHVRLNCPPLSLRVHSNSRPSSW